MPERHDAVPDEGAIRLSSADGRLLSARLSGPEHGSPVVLIHGAGGSSASWNDEFVTTLGTAGNRVLRLDLRGAGSSTPAASNSGRDELGDFVSDVIALLDHLDWSQAVLVGAWSGALVAEGVGRSFPARCTALVLISPLQAATAHEIAVLRPVLDGLVRRDGFGHQRLVPRPAQIEYLVRYLTAMAGSATPHELTTRAATALVDHTTDLLGQLRPPDLAAMQAALLAAGAPPTCPTVVVHGSEDPVLRLERVSGVAAALPSARLLLLSGGGHADLPPSAWPVLRDLLPLLRAPD